MSTQAEQKLLKVWTLPDSQRRDLLRPALAKLYDPNVSEAYFSEWIPLLCETSKAVLERNAAYVPPSIIPGGPQGFINSCISAGLIEAMLRVADLVNPPLKDAPVLALVIWHCVIKAASRSRKQAALPIEHMGYVKDGLIRSLKSDLFMQRAQAAICIGGLMESPWGRDVTNEDIADMMFECLLYATAGHQSVLDELDTRSKAWQKNYMRESERPHDEAATIDEARTYSPRFWSESRDTTLSAVESMVSGRARLTARRDCLQIINFKPQILNQLLSLIRIERTPWHPESIVDVTAAKILTHLLIAPHLWIPDLHASTFFSSTTKFPPGQNRDNSDAAKEWDATVSSWTIFVERTQWRETLSEKWKKLQAETREDILKKFRQTPRYMALAPPDATELDRATNNRGVCRACILRLLINVTYGEASVDPMVPTSDLLSLLPLAYEASQKVPSPARVVRSKRHANGAHGRDALLRVERTAEMCYAGSGSPFGQTSLACIIVASEYTLGPVLLLRILRRVYESFNSDVTSWTSLPPNTPPDTHLGQIQQIASPDVLGVVMRNVALKRISAMKDEGTRRLREKLEDPNFALMEADFARAAYLAAAELAVVADRFDKSAGPEREEWGDLMTSVRKEIVACLGNISEMSYRLGEWEHQWWYATHAVASLDGVDEAAAKREGWDPAALRAKNQRREAAASSNILAKKSL